MCLVICKSRKNWPKQKGFLCHGQWKWDPDRHIHRPPRHNSRGRHSGGALLERSHEASAESTLCSSPVGNKINSKNLYQVKLIGKYCGSRVGVEVGGGAIKPLYFRFMPFLIWATVKLMFYQYLLLIFAPEWRKDAQAQHKYEGGTARFKKRRELTLK